MVGPGGGSCGRRPGRCGDPIFSGEGRRPPCGRANLDQAGQLRIAVVHRFPVAAPKRRKSSGPLLHKNGRERCLLSKPRPCRGNPRGREECRGAANSMGRKEVLRIVWLLTLGAVVTVLGVAGRAVPLVDPAVPCAFAGSAQVDEPLRKNLSKACPPANRPRQELTTTGNYRHGKVAADVTAWLG